MESWCNSSILSVSWCRHDLADHKFSNRSLDIHVCMVLTLNVQQQHVDACKSSQRKLNFIVQKAKRENTWTSCRSPVCRCTPNEFSIHCWLYQTSTAWIALFCSESWPFIYTKSNFLYVWYVLHVSNFESKRREWKECADGFIKSPNV